MCGSSLIISNVEFGITLKPSIKDGGVDELFSLAMMWVGCYIF